MPLTGAERAAAFLDWADAAADGMEAQYGTFDERGDPAMTSIWYRDRPSPGWGVGLTYGMSVLAESRFELMIVVRSRDPAWSWALGHFVDMHRDSIGDLRLGDTINWHKPIARHTKMSAFFIGPAVLAPDAGGIVHLAEDDHVQLVQAIPIYEAELPLVRELGAASFGRLVGDRIVDPRRDPVRPPDDGAPRGAE